MKLILPVYLKISFLIILLIGVMTFAYPSYPTLAATSCPTSSFGVIQLESGLLSLGNQSRSSSFYTSNAETSCIIDTKAKIPQFAVLSYGEMKSIYYDQAKNISGVTKNPTPAPAPGSNLESIDLSSATDSLYHINGDFNATDSSDADTNADPQGSRTGVFFIDGNLTISNNITYGSETAGLVFIVRGDVKVLSTVTQINALIITGGIFCSSLAAADQSCGTLPPLRIATPTPPILTDPALHINTSKVYQDGQVTVSWKFTYNNHSVRLFRQEADGSRTLIDWFYPISNNCSTIPPSGPTPTPGGQNQCLYRMPSGTGTYRFALFSGDTEVPTSGNKQVEVIPPTSQLVINGSVISLSSNYPPKFVRDRGDNSQPSEIINYQPKYLVILKDIFSKDLTIWREIK